MAMWGYILWYQINVNIYGKNVACITSDEECQMMCSSTMNVLYLQKLQYVWLPHLLMYQTLVSLYHKRLHCEYLH